MTTYDVPTRLGFVIPDDTDAPQVFLMQLPDGPPVVLHDVSAVIWVLAADGEDDVVGAVSEIVGRPREQVDSEVEKHLEVLVMEGLLAVRND